jgi:exonuclease SbcC
MLNTIAARGFRGLTDAEIALGDAVTLVLGPNGSGKSSIAAAIEYALTGSCRWTDAAGRGYARLIAHTATGGADVLLTGALVADGDIVMLERTLQTGGGSVLYDDGKRAREGKDALTFLSTILPPTDLLLSMLRSDGLTGLPAKEQQDLLFALAGGETDAAWFRERLTKSEAEAISDELATRLKGSALSDGLYKSVYARRTQANKTVKEAGGRLAAYPEPTGEPVDTAAVESELAELREKLGKVQTQIGKASGAAEAQQRAGENVTTAQAAVKRLREALSDLLEPDEVEDELVPSLETDLAAARERLVEARQKVSAANGARAALQEQLDAFVALKGKCVLGDLACPMAATDRKAVIKATQDKCDSYEAEISAANRTADGAEDDITQAVAAIDEARKAQAAAAAYTSKRTNLESQLAEAEHRSAAATAAYQSTKAPATHDLRNDAQTITLQIAELENMLAEARTAATNAAAREQVEKQLKAAQVEAATLDALVKKLSPDGLPAQAMGETLGAVLEAINEVLSSFTDFTLSAEPGKDFALIVTRDGEQTPVACLSESETLMVGAAIQVAFARLTEWGFVVVDAADRLDGPNRGLLLGMLLRSGVQALVLATPANGGRPQAPGLVVYELRDGAAHLVGAVEAQVAS